MSKMLTPEEIVECQCDFLQFCRVVFKAKTGTDFDTNWHHLVIAEALEKVYLGEIKRLIINMPPRHGKTELAVIFFTAWAFGHYPKSMFIHTSYTKKVASDNSYQIREILKSEIYQEIFGDISLEDGSKAKDEWRTKQGGKMYSVGIGGSIVGFGAGILGSEFGGAMIIDDPHKIIEANTLSQLIKIQKYFGSSIENRLNDKDTPIILIMQRLNLKDLSGFLLAGGNGEKWHHLEIPALATEESVKQYPQSVVGEALWEARKTREQLETLKIKSAYTFDSQYQQTPTPLGGGIFKETWWQYYSGIGGDPTMDATPNVEFMIITGDTANKTKSYNDWSVFQCWGYWNNNIYLLDQIRGKWEAPDLKKQFLMFWNKHNGTGTATTGYLRAAYIEDAASGTGLIQDIGQNYSIPIEAIKRRTDKVTRAMDGVDYIKSGRVHLNENAEYLSEYVNEHSAFSGDMTHTNDDQIDPTLDAIDILLRQIYTEDFGIC